MFKLLLISILSLTGFASEYGTINGELRAFSFDRSFDNTAPDSKAVTAGGIVRYTTPTVSNLSASVAYYGSFNTGIYSDTQGKSTALLQADGSNIGFLGEANIKFDNGEEQLVIGRQRLSTPLANDHDLRLLPSTYQGVTASYKPYGVQVGHITKYSGFGSKYDGFNDIDSFSFIAVSKFNANAQYIHSDVRDYYYADYMHTFNDLTLRAQVGGNDNKFADNSVFYGAKATYKFKYVDASILSDEIRGNNFKAIESGALYTDWMQGYAIYEPSKAYGFQLANVTGNFSTTIGAVTVTNGIIDDYTEYQADEIYQITKDQKLRFRYSEKHQSATSLREDRNDMRVIYYLAF